MPAGIAVSVCVSCRMRLRRPPAPRCERCDHPVRFALGGACPICEALPDVVGTVRSAVLHRPPAGALVHAFKYDGWLDLAGSMAERMESLLPQDADSLVPVASPPRRRRSRGFNPSEELARCLSRRTGIPVREALRRPADAPRQVGLSPDQRAANVRNAFVPTVDGIDESERLVLVDDVFTTGATAAAAATTLGQVGAVRVDVLTFARAIPVLPGGADAS